MDDGEDGNDPGRIPVQHQHVGAGGIAEIHQPAGDDQRAHGDEEQPVQQNVDRAQSRRATPPKPAQAHPVRLHATRKTRSDHVDRIGERYRKQHHGRLHMRRPHALIRNQEIELIDPGAIGCFAGDPQTADERGGERDHRQPVQDDRSIIGLALSHVRPPPQSGSPQLRPDAARRLRGLCFTRHLRTVTPPILVLTATQQKSPQNPTLANQRTNGASLSIASSDHFIVCSSAFDHPGSKSRERRPIVASANNTKNCLASWLHSAETEAIACRSKVIGGRIYDAGI